MPKPFTTESAAAAKEAADAQRALYSRVFMEDDRWKEIAKEAGVVLPPFFARPSGPGVAGMLRRLGIPWNAYVEAYGWNTIEEFERLNPTWGMRPLAGLILELWDEKRRLVEACSYAADGRGAVRGDGKPRKEHFPRGLPKAKRAKIKPVNE